ncbi:MAG TPA: outer membrane lipoprotein carrier protein LolA [Microvirga sp.]|nr:outer membrane lipoprotein carrier protein LolA [Microvirga sp.]
MLRRSSLAPLVGLAAALACAAPGAARDSLDSVSRFRDGAVGVAASSGAAAPLRAPASAEPEPSFSGPAARATVATAASPDAGPGRRGAASQSARPAPAPDAAQPPSPQVPSSPEAALSRLNAYFNGIDQLTASFVQTSPNGRAEGTLWLRRPGQLRFAYAPPSTLEIVSDGRSVAIRDPRLGTNDVYPVGQTPLKFLLQPQFDLARDTTVRDVQVSPNGMVSVRFDDRSTVGGTSRVTLRFDARADRLQQWTVIDPQGYETTVTLSDVRVVRR